MEVQSILVNSVQQTLRFSNLGGEEQVFSIATAKNGLGEVFGSECTPRGRHYIRAKIGGGENKHAIFKSRRPTGECYDPYATPMEQHDWILGRILWLCGLDQGVNRGGIVDTMRRYIYIHGSPDHMITGVPSSKGCIRMRTDDLLVLFDLVEVGCKVMII